MTTPVLVELLPSGRVRSLVGARPVIDGVMPAESLQQAQDNRGLMLYAQSDAELHWRDSGGPVIGRLHPGAFVSVVPSRDAMVRIGNLPFRGEGSPIVAYVERNKLGIKPMPLSGRVPRPDLRSVRWHKTAVIGWTVEADPLRMQPVWSSVPCVDIWMSRDAKWATQYVEGVELFGAVDSVNVAWPTMHVPEFCPAHVVAQEGEKLVWNGIDGSEEHAVIDRIPDGYRAYHPPDPDPLLDAVLHRKKLFWLIDSPTGPRCDEWRIEGTTRGDATSRVEARIVRRERLEGLVASYRIRYLPRHENGPAVFHLGTIEFSDGSTLKCECTTDYALLGVDVDALDLMSRPIPDRLVAYDPGEVERWFLSVDACQHARDAIARTLEHDGTAAARLGFHAIVYAYGI